MRALLLAAALAVAGCATTSAPPPPAGPGTVMSIQETQETSTGARVVGSIGGAVLGAMLGSQIGGGSGQTIATAVGGVGGSMAGSAIADRVGATAVWDVTVRFDDGIDRTLRVRERPAFRPGDRVDVQGGSVRTL